MFGRILLIVFSVMLGYVVWHLLRLPFIKRIRDRIAVLMFGAVIWLLFYAGRYLFRHRSPYINLEMLGMICLGVVFICFFFLLLVDIVTIFGLIFRKAKFRLRSAALFLALFVSGLSIIQAIRAPVVENYEIALPGLASDLDGINIVAISDTHIGEITSSKWLAKRVEQMLYEKPDAIVFLGDIFEGHDAQDGDVVQALKKLRAPLGVWAVLGNHDQFGRGSEILYQQAGIKLIRNQWFEIRKGLIFVGVDNLSGRSSSEFNEGMVSAAFRGIKEGSIIFLSHSPLQVEQAASYGTSLMLSGHTHGGQIWPFGYLVSRRYPYLAGKYQVNDMTLIVSRGAGTWGPKMRLWKPGEILNLTLRSK